MSRKRQVLLLEPNYKNKYPPIGLMKIAWYHRFLLRDKVTFFKGDLNQFVLDQVGQECIAKLYKVDSTIDWRTKQTFVKEFIKKKEDSLFDDLDFVRSSNQALIRNCLAYYRKYFLQDKYFQKPRFDRVYVTTLFTFYWDITIQTILFAKRLVKNHGELKVGGIAASLLPEQIEADTGIKPLVGLLDEPGMLDDNDIIVDDLPLDYSILDETDYQYPSRDAYFSFMTKGCKRKCEFCSVPKLEPEYKNFVPTLDKFNQVTERFGEQQHLLLLDNNVLPSPRFAEIIRDIKEMGFVKGATYVEPNQLDIAIRNLEEGFNDKAYIRRSYRLLQDLSKRLKGQRAQQYEEILERFDLLSLETTTKENLLAAYPEIAELYEQFRLKTPKQRFVDFNQGIDCRYITEEKMKLLSEIPIMPLRIAFDHLTFKEKYIKAIELAAKYGIRELSNYLLYNYLDSPEDLYERLSINQKLSVELDLHIYSFPMKYIPLDPKGREHLGPHWNRKFIRAVQCILNVTRGIVAHSINPEKGSFFEKAFGRNLEEFQELLYMPETYIVYRKLFEEELGYTEEWLTLFRKLRRTPSKNQFEEVKRLIEINDFSEIPPCLLKNAKMFELLKHYLITRGDVEKAKEKGDYGSLEDLFESLVPYSGVSARLFT